MSATFTEFLRAEAAKEAAKYGNVKETVEEWRAAVENLFRRLRAWLAESDPDGIIEIKERPHEVREPHLGHYDVPRLDLQAFGKWIGIIPKARLTMAAARPPRAAVPRRAAGRVDITDELSRHVLFRFPESDGDVWMIENGDSEPRPLDRETFEKALLSHLR